MSYAFKVTLPRWLVLLFRFVFRIRRVKYGRLKSRPFARLRNPNTVRVELPATIARTVDDYPTAPEPPDQPMELSVSEIMALYQSANDELRNGNTVVRSPLFFEFLNKYEFVYFSTAPASLSVGIMLATTVPENLVVYGWAIVCDCTTDPIAGDFVFKSLSNWRVISGMTMWLRAARNFEAVEFDRPKTLTGFLPIELQTAAIGAFPAKSNEEQKVLRFYLLTEKTGTPKIHEERVAEFQEMINTIKE